MEAGIVTKNTRVSLADQYMAMFEQFLIGSKSIHQYMTGVNDIHGWMMVSGSKLKRGVEWRYERAGLVQVAHRYFGYVDIACSSRSYEPIPDLYGQEAKEAHLEELKMGLKSYSRQ